MKIGRGNVASPASLAAPVGGWNARDALGEMAPMDAVYLTNFFPSTSDVMVRNGYTSYATGLSGQVETIMAYSGGSTDKLFGISGGNIYNVTAGGAVGAPNVTGLSNSRFQYINVATSGGNFLLSVNGVDKLRGYDGTNWWIDGDGSHDISNVDTATCVQINLFKNRVWLIQNNTLNAWYLPTSAIAGAATAFPLQGVAEQGGYIMAMATWTIDAGYGVDDLAAFITSKGEVIVYRGTDPSSATTWSLVGVWSLGTPIGRRCFIKYAGDLLLICQDGIVPMSGALQSSRTNPRVAITDKIQNAVSNAVTSYGSNYGWQMLYYPKTNMLILNVPVEVGTSQQQYVMNTITKAWCNFEGWDANCWEIYQDNPYFGGNGFVAKAWSGLDDGGDNINFIGKQAFNYFGMPGINKRWTMMRPILSSNGTPSIQANVNVDFENINNSTPISFIPTPYGVWDSGIWDASIWGGDNNILKSWQGVTGIGYCAAPVIRGATKGIEAAWISTDLVMERGSVL